jgi:serine protease Do
MPNSKSYAQVYYIAGPSPPGTSGGAWINTKGELVGVQSMLMSVTNSAHGISFVVPPEAVGELLKNKRTASTPSLGMAVEEIWQHTGGMRKKYGQDAAGLFVRASRKGSPAQKAGLKEWELIQSIDLKQFDRAEDFIDYIRAKKKGESVKLSVLAPGGKKPRSVTMQLGDLETNWTSKQTANKTPAKADSSPATKTRT